jgi:hypothetical protein
VSNQILAGQVLTAGTGQGQLSQYYGLADTTQTTVTAAASTALSSAYVIPAGEANYAGVAYELECGGQGTWGSTQQALTFAMYIGGTFGSGATAAAASLSISATFSWIARMKLICSDGTSSWWAGMWATVQQNTNNVLPGTAADNSVPLISTNSAARTASTASSITVEIQAKWASTTGSPTLTNYWTTFRKTA